VRKETKAKKKAWKWERRERNEKNWGFEIYYKKNRGENKIEQQEKYKKE
jgi:hypothetical protein